MHIIAMHSLTHSDNGFLMMPAMSYNITFTSQSAFSASDLQKQLLIRYTTVIQCLLCSLSLMEYHKQWLFISTDIIVLCCTMLLFTTKAGWKCTHYLDMMYCLLTI